VAEIFRFNPSTDKKPRYERYKIPWREKLTVLEVLRYVYENYSPVAFRYGCRSGFCGRCGVMVNKKPVLACLEFLKPGFVKIEPLRGLPIIRDLVVDRSKFEVRTLQLNQGLVRTNKPIREPEILSGAEVQKISEVLKCRSCYLCEIACPVVEINWENSCGPALRVRNLALRIFDPRDQLDRVVEVVSEGLWYCTHCGRCKEVCPSDIDTIQIFRDISEIVVKKGLILPEHQIIISNLSKNLNPYNQKIEERVAWLKNLGVRPPKLNNADMVYFIGCTNAYKRKEIAESVIYHLKRTNTPFTVLENECCCGFIAYTLGFKELARRLSFRNIRLIKESGAKKILVSCPGCYWTLKNEYPKLTDEFPEIIYISNFLAALIEKGKLKLDKEINERVLYHDPCHLGRGSGIYNSPRDVLGKIQGLKVVKISPNKEYGICCGADGGVKVAFPNVAISIAREILLEAEEQKASTIVTSCPFCKTNIRDAIHRNKKNLQVLDLTELLKKVVG
jgi:fumarate reductase (CoM/CoB) subunit B